MTLPLSHERTRTARGCLHVAMFSNVYLPTINGVVSSVHSFRQGLMERGHIVYVMAPHATEPYRQDERFVFRYPAMELPLQRYPLTLPISPFIDLLLPCLAPDILHAHHPVMLGRVAARKSRELGRPLVFTYHTRYQEYSHYVKGVPEPMVKEFLDSLLAGFMRRCHHVVVPSESIRDLLEVTYGISSRVSVVASGVDRTRFSAGDRETLRRELGWNPEDLVVLSLGRLAREKNWELLLRAMLGVKEKEPKARLLVVGGGEEKERLESLAAEMGLQGRVTFSGPIPAERVPLYLGASDIFAFASLTETQGLATLEAMASGLPVVAVDASGTRDVLRDGREGFLTPCDSDAVAERLLQLLADPDLRLRYGQAGLQRAAEFDVAGQSARLETVYRSALDDYAAGYRVPVQAVPSRSALRRLFTYFQKGHP